MFGFGGYWIGAMLSAMMMLIGGGTAWKVQEARYEAKLSKLEHSMLLAEKASLEAVKAQDDAATAKLRKATDEATKREQKLRNGMASLRRSGDGLRDTIARLAVATSEPDAASTADPPRAAAVGELLGECADEYRSMAEKAQRHADDAKMMFDAWPE